MREQPSQKFERIIALERKLRSSEAATNCPPQGTGPHQLLQLRNQVNADRRSLGQAIDTLTTEQLTAYGKYRLHTLYNE